MNTTMTKTLQLRVAPGRGHASGSQGVRGVRVSPAVASLRDSSISTSSGHTDQAVDTKLSLTRRAAIASSVAWGPLMSLMAPEPAAAVMGMTAGRVPGLSSPDEQGYLTYTRPEGKSGGHGIGWSEIPKYTFKVTEGWEEQAVSIADLGGTEIDIRFANQDMGELAVVVAPVLRFMDVGFNAQVTMSDIGSPEKIIEGFAPELWGQPLSDGELLDTQVYEKDGNAYYRWEVKPFQKSQHLLIAATATRNRLFIMLLGANPRQWRKAKGNLSSILESFEVPQVGA